MRDTNHAKLQAQHFIAWRNNTRRNKVLSTYGRRQRILAMQDRYARLQSGDIRPCPENCEVCGGKSPAGRSLSWDHNHETGLFRGWLCNWCNVAIGHAKEDPEILRRLADYLERDGIPELQGA